MNITLFYPPISTAIYSPPNALGALNAFLKLKLKDDYNVDIKDLNIEFNNYIFSNWKEVSVKFRGYFSDILSNGKLKDEERKIYSKLLFIYIPIIDELLSKECSYEEKVLLFRFVRIVIEWYFLFGVIYDSYFVRCDYLTLSRIVNNFLFDSVISAFIDCFSIEKSKVFGFSLLSESQLPFAILISRIIRIKNKESVFIAGGPYITEMLPHMSKEVFQDFDYIVGQEGETALINIIKSIDSNQLARHPNVFTVDCPYIGHDNFIIESIESLPAPNFSGLDLSAYCTQDAFLPVYSSKGCSWGRCLFCSQNSISYREMSVDKFIDNIEKVSRQTGYVHFQFIDENIYPSRLEKISEKIISNNLKIRWFIQVRLEKGLSISILKKMKEAGCYAIEFGLESGNQEMLRIIKKGINLKNVERILKDCAELDIEVILNCMVGFPGETIDQAKETVYFIENLASKIPNLRFSCNTQSVKIYKTSRYAILLGIPSTFYPLSTITKWNEPVWLNNFCHDFRNHAVFTGASVNSGNNITECYNKKNIWYDPVVRLQPYCYLLEEVKYNFKDNIETDELKFYIAIIRNFNSEPTIFLVNEPMSFIVKILTQGPVKLSYLRNKFHQSYDCYDYSDVDVSFKKGLLRLNEIEGLSVQ